jgi:hypothetical protein
MALINMLSKVETYKVDNINNFATLLFFNFHVAKFCFLFSILVCNVLLKNSNIKAKEENNRGKVTVL